VLLSNVFLTRYAITVKDCMAIFVDASLVTSVEDPELISILPSPEFKGKWFVAMPGLSVLYHAVLSQCYMCAVLREASIEVDSIMCVVVLFPTFSVGKVRSQR
jgi:hypothetical protein